MEPANESLETLESKLNDYRANLETISEALECEPDSTELLKLKEDLEEVIAYFADLVGLKKEESGRIEEVVVAPAAKNLIDKTCVLTTSKQLQFGVIRGFGGIDKETSLPKSVRVYWFGSKREDIVDVSSVRLLSPVNAGSLKVGMEAQALYSEDGQWYKCVVKSISDDGCDYLVEYEGYGNEEIVPNHRVRALDTNVGGSSSSSSKKREVLTPGGYRIPANLVVKPTDTDAQKAEKRRRLHKLKREQKIASEEVDARSRQVSWQSHMKKSMTRPTHRVGTALLGTKSI